MTDALALTYSRARDADAPVAEDLAHLVDVASNIRTMASDRLLYADVRMVDGRVRFVVEVDPLPTYGAVNVARGLVTRAVAEAGTPGSLVEDSCENITI